MRYRLLGQTGLRVSELFLGTMRFGSPRTSPDEARRIVDRYAEAGGNVLDTASAYGESEAILGELLAGRRDEFVLATKYTLTRNGSDPNAAGNHRKNLVLSLEESLRRLRTDYVDLFWVHMWDRNTPLEETMRALDDAVRAGKVLYVGVSDAPAWVVARANTLAEWRAWTPFAAVQEPYNVGARDIERETLPMAEALGLSVAAWAPLAHGALMKPDGGEVAVAVREVACELGSSPAQVAVAWLRGRSRLVHPLAGPGTVEQLADILRAFDLTLPAEARRRLDGAAGFTAGFPGDFITEVSPQVFGEVSALVDGR